MEINIDMLNVGDGDAIIVTLQDGIKSLVLLIDAGRAHHSELVISALNKTLRKHLKSGPDVVMVTHYDSDHIGGVAAVLGEYNQNIGELWVHTPQFNSTNILNPLYLKPRLVTLATSEEMAKQINVVMESVDELNLVLGQAKNIGVKVREPIAGECKIDGWPNIVVLGPTRAYFKDIFKQIITAEDFIKSESENLLYESQLHDAKGKDPWKQLPSVSKISNTNKACAIVLITVNNKKYLFTGDAGIQSFTNIPNYKFNLKDIYWLKAPHHGSINNLSSELINIMNPVHVFISGDKHIDDCVTACFRSKGSNVKTTRSGHLQYSSAKDKLRQMLRDV